MHLGVQYWISHYGYIGVFFILLIENLGVPFPAETTLVLSGIEWTKGAFAFLPLLVAASLGNIFGSTAAYGIGYFLGRPIVMRIARFVGIKEQKWAKAEGTFAKYRGFVVLFGKFIAGIRVLVPYLAGIERMPFLTFSLFNAISALVWVVAFTTLGRFAGVAWSHYHRVMHQYLVPGLIALAVLVALYVALKRRYRQA
ncbi:DedA family protein [Kyrpidia tusciae]|uniref:SNARE associated Golgi protein-associated protein n=1 Tax=Kyrpidia tusciae (strain DSM 2912 / NBRC 15312 / T2) TaxID=562970 RepID=D5WQT2_KYRT2|nr:DedA family protein [Kyrpidia tusciae]ADG06691.1 SNARE associated Golgi protein-associated protein [Kyrpidia tusciae DSM 2912]